jgi:Ca2+-binding RTX toxin-like protein
MSEQTIDGNNRSNIIISGSSDDTINAGGGNDIVISGAGDDTINGGSGCDIIISGSGDDVLNGGSGSDILISGSGADTVNGGSGNDILITGSGDDIANGGSGNDVIITGSGDDIANGGSGNDYISTGTGDDAATGGSGNDVIITGSGYDSAEGNAGHDVIITGTGNDTVSGGSGNDIIISGAGDDVVDGGTGHDVILSGSGNDTVIAGDGDDVVITGYGDDVVDGGAGQDWIHAGADNDTIDAGAGNDTINGGSGTDIAIFSGQQADYQIVEIATNTYTVTNSISGEVDTVKNVELFRFDDRDMDPANPTVNADPTANNDSVSLDEDSSATINVLANDTDLDGDALSVTTASASNGAVVINLDGTVTYTPNADFNGSDTISYEISDGNGGTATATVAVTVNAIGDAPEAINDVLSLDEDSSATIDVLLNDTDLDGDALNVTNASATNGTVLINFDGSLTYTPNANFNGSDTINYEISDGNGGSAAATVDVTVNTVNDGPVANTDSVTLDEDSSTTINVLANDTDLDGDALSVTTASATNGAVVINLDGTVTYTPNADFNGSDTISYEISDGNGGTATSVVSVTVLPVAENDAPVAVDDAITVEAGSNGVIAELILIWGQGFQDTTVLVNDSDADGDTLSIIEANGQALVGSSITLAGSNGGTFTIFQNGKASFDASTDFGSIAPGGSVDTQINYTVSDGHGGTDTATVTVTVRGANVGPEAVADSAATNEDEAVVIDIMSNDTDLEGDILSVTAASASNGTVVINSDGTLTYTPNANFNGSDTINYTISDGLDSASTTVAVTVNAINDDAVAVNDNLNITENVTSTLNVLSNDLDADGDELSIISATAANGTIVINADNTLDYTPDSNVQGVDTISYEITDGNGQTSSAIATVNRLPITIDDTAATDEDVSIVIDVLSNDSDADGHVLSVNSASAANGSIVIQADGSLSYTPNTGFYGTDQITYAATDSHGGLSTAHVIVTVTSAAVAGNNAPVAVDDAMTVDAGSDGLIADLILVWGQGYQDTTVLVNDTDVDGDVLSITHVNGQALVNNTITIAGSNGGTFTVYGNGKANFDASTGFEVLAPGQSTVTEITYTVDDGRGGVDTATVRVTVNGIDGDGLLAVDDQTTMTEGQAALVLDVLANDDSYIPGDVVTVTAVDGVAANLGTAVAGSNGGLFIINADGSASFDQNGAFGYLQPNEVATTTVTYTIEGSSGDTSTATVEIEVAGGNNAPVAVDDAVTVEAGSNGVIADLILIWGQGYQDSTVLVNDTDSDGDTLSIIEVNGQALVGSNLTMAGSNGGMFTVFQNGKANFDASTDFDSIPLGSSTTSSITYTVSDGHGGTDTATVEVTVNGVNDNPLAVDDSITATESGAVTVDVLANDSDIDGQSVSIASIDSSNLSGTVIDNGDGTVTYDANQQFDYLNDGESAMEWFEYSIDDGLGGLDTAQVLITIQGSTANGAATASSTTTPTETLGDTTTTDDSNDFMV